MKHSSCCDKLTSLCKWPIRSCTVMKKKFVAGTLSLVLCFGNVHYWVEEKPAIQFNTVIIVA